MRPHAAVMAAVMPAMRPVIAETGVYRYVADLVIASGRRGYGSLPRGTYPGAFEFALLALEALHVHALPLILDRVIIVRRAAVLARGLDQRRFGQFDQRGFAPSRWFC